MKYIDSEKLIAEIERMRKINRKAFEADHIESDIFHGRTQAINHLFEFITSLQQEQPKIKLVKVRCVFPFDKTWEKDKIYTCEVWHHGDLNRNFWDVYYDYGKDPKYVQFPTIESLNEEFAIIKDESQVIPEQTEVDLEKEIDKESQKLHIAPCYDELKKFAKYFYELGLNARKEE